MLLVAAALVACAPLMQWCADKWRMRRERQQQSAAAFVTQQGGQPAGWYGWLRALRHFVYVSVLLLLLPNAIHGAGLRTVGAELTFVTVIGMCFIFMYDVSQRQAWKDRALRKLVNLPERPLSWLEQFLAMMLPIVLISCGVPMMTMTMAVFAVVVNWVMLMWEARERTSRCSRHTRACTCIYAYV